MALNNLGLGFLITAKDQASAVFNRVGKSVSGVNKQLGAGRKAFAQHGEQLRHLGTRMAAVGAAALVGFGFAAKVAGDYEKAIAEVTTLTDEATFPTERMRELTQGLADDFGVDAIQQAGALYQTISAGVTDAADATKLLTAANKFAIAGVTDVATGVDVLTTALNSYKSQGLTAAQASDALFIAIREGKTTAGELGKTLGRVIPIASSLGIGFDEVAAAVATITTKGIKTKEAVTGLKASLANIIKPSKAAEKAAKDLNLQLGTEGLKAAGGFKGWLDKLAASGATEQQMVDIFGSIEGLNAIMALTSEGGAKLQSVMDKMANKAGSTEAAFQKMNQTFSQATKRLKASFTNALISVGDALAPVISAVARFITMVVQGFNKLPKPLKTAIATFGALAAVALVVVGGLLGLVGTVAGLVAAKAALVVATKAVAVALGVVLVAAAPLILIFAGMKQAWETDLGGIRTFVTSTFAKVKLAFQALSQFFQDGKLSGDVAKEFLSADEGTKNFILTLIQAGTKVKAFLAGLSAGFRAAVHAAGPAIEGFVAALQELGTALGLSATPSKDAGARFKELAQTGATVGAVLGKAFHGIVTVITFLVRGVTFLVGAWRSLTSATGGVGNALSILFPGFLGINILLQNMGGIVDVAKAAWQALSEIFSAVSGSASSAGSSFSLVGTVFSALGGIVQHVVGMVGGQLSALAGFIRSAGRFIAGVLSGDWGAAWQGFLGVVASVVKGVLGLVAGMVTGITKAIDAAAKAVGKDLGLTKKVAGLEKELTAELDKLIVQAPAKPATSTPQAEAPTFTPPPPTAGPGAPAVASAEGSGATAAALEKLAASPKPIKIESKTDLKVDLDGDVLVDKVITKVEERDARAGGSG